jgi:hypothetical protein
MLASLAHFPSQAAGTVKVAAVLVENFEDPHGFGNLQRAQGLVFGRVTSSQNRVPSISVHKLTIVFVGE